MSNPGIYRNKPTCTMGVVFQMCLPLLAGDFSGYLDELESPCRLRVRLRHASLHTGLARRAHPRQLRRLRHRPAEEVAPPPLRAQAPRQHHHDDLEA
jgi:hypothetical protein